MRKLIVGSVVFVILLGTWKLYLDYDTKRFVHRLPTPPVPKQHQDGTPKTDAVTPKERVNKTATEALENAYEPSLSETSEDFTRLVETEADAVFDAETPEIEPETDNSGLSPELETFFSEYYPIDQEMFEVSKELNPLLRSHITSSHRITEIISEELASAPDETTKQTLYDEFDKIHVWQKSVTPRLIELQNEQQRLSNERSAIFAKYDISSWEDFKNLYGEAYNAWKFEK
ncbi:MAG: hypothetical protein OXU51_05810 [Candidatus Poribacteria bacterium]|nr:hypothetical protein [Candidatus Poribacteria bacterium]